MWKEWSSWIFTTKSKTVVKHSPKQGAKGLKKLKKDDKNYKSNIFILGAFMSYVFSFALLVTYMRFDDRLDPQGDKVFNKVFPCFRYIKA